MSQDAATPGSDPTDTAVAWVFLHPDAVPPAWRDRGRPLVFVPLIADEVQALLGQEPVTPMLRADEHRMASLVAEGRTTVAIARELGVSRSTVQRRLTGLRNRFGVRSQVELALALARQGFADLNP